MQVVKNIIPAIASTNALISAECINEALKFRSRAGQRLDNFMMFMGGMQTGTNSETVQYGRNPDCRACSLPLIYTVDEKNTTLEDLYNKLVNEAKLDKPSLSNIDGEPLYMPKLHDFYAASFAHSLAIAGVKHRDYLVAQDTNKVFKKILILTEDGVRQEEAEMEE